MDKEAIIKRWLRLSKKFSVSFEKRKPTLKEIMEKLEELEKKENLDSYDVEAILKLTFGEEAGAFLDAIYLKKKS